MVIKEIPPGRIYSGPLLRSDKTLMNSLRGVGKVVVELPTRFAKRRPKHVWLRIHKTHVDWKKSVLKVFASKTGKFLVVPMNADTRRILEACLVWKKNESVF
jgi:hypothetical protein